MNYNDSTPSPYQSAQPGRRAPLRWSLIILLGAVALIRALLHITGITAEDGGVPAGVAAVGATLVISIVWILTVLLTRTERPFLTLVLAALVYAVLSMVLSAPLSLIIDGELQGPFAQPIAIPAVLITNAVWGAITGGIAWLISAALGRN